jgi:transglutaminase-like putative cysteine protease
VKKSLLISVIVVAGCNQYSCGQSSAKSEAENAPSAPGIVYSNPRVYNVDYCFEMFPDPNKIDRAKDLKVWIPIPREWDSQKAVKIISVQPEPRGRYVDPEYGNPMLFWDFGQEPEQATYKVDIKFRLESYDISVEVDPNRVGSYDKTSKEYALYTRSTHTIHITPKIRELAQEAVGDETNPYLQAERIVKFVGKKMRYKILDFERGRGIDCLLAYAVADEKTGQEYYEGSCNQFTALMVALCRAVGIPARCVSGYIGWNPWVKKDDLKASYPFETKLSPGGLAATQFYGKLGSHMWVEFFIPNYGWIPTDPTSGRVGHQDNQWWIKWKGRDIQIGPYAPPEDSNGYGVNWVALHDGRADGLNYGILNIAKIRTSKVTILHHSDPFPAVGLAGYPGNPLLSDNGEKNLRHWRQRVLSWPSDYIRNRMPDNLNLDQFYKDYPPAKDDREAFVCHMLRRQLGEEKFFGLVDTYVELRQKSGQAVPTSRFQELAEDIYGEPLGWFFNQWVNRIELPRLKLEKVVVRKDNEGWQVQGRLAQAGNAIFRLPIELALDTKKGREKQKLWVEKKGTDFEFRTLREPRKLVVDPDYEVLKVQKMPPRLWCFWDLEPEFIVIYGTSGEAQANERTAERLARDYLEYGREIIKADTDVNDADLKTKCVFLIGRPETNKVAQQFKDSFPIKFDGDQFTWQGMRYDKAAQGLAQVIEHPQNGEGLMIMYAGLSPEATLKLCDLQLDASECSYVIFDGDKQSATGDWEDVDGNLYWSFDTQPSAR